MDCKIVREYLDGHTLDIDKDLFLEHMKSCTECQAHEKSESVLEEDLKILFNQGIDSSYLNKNIIRKTRSKQRRTSVIVAASLLVLFMSFSTEIISFAEKIPFIQDIIEMLNHDQQVEFAIEKGYPVQEYISDNGEYILMVKDIYVDSIDFRMQFTLLDKNGEVPIGTSLKFKMPGITRDSYQHPMEPENPWQSFSIDVSKKIRQMETFAVEFEVINNNEVTSFESVYVDISHLKTYTFDYVQLQKVIELPTGKVEIMSIDLGPTAATVKYKMIEQYDSVETSLELMLVDSNGREYCSNGSSWSSNSPVYTVKFEYSNLESDVEDIKLKIVGYSYNDVMSVGAIENETLSFPYKDYEYTLNQYLDQGRDKRGRLTTTEILNAELFPDLCIKEGSNWTAAMMCQMDQEYLPVSSETIIKALGEDYDTSNPATVNQFLDYMEKEKDIEFDEESLLEWPSILDRHDTVYLKTVKVFLIDNEEVQWKTSLRSEGLEFGIIGELHFEDLSIEIEIKPSN
jgi:hypothetical protein